jgi:hypothetical protein
VCRGPCTIGFRTAILRLTVSLSFLHWKDVVIQLKVPDSHKKCVFIGTSDRISCVSPSSTDEEFLDRRKIVFRRV